MGGGGGSDEGGGKTTCPDQQQYADGPDDFQYRIVCKQIWNVGIKIERLKRSRTYYATFRGQVVQGHRTKPYNHQNVSNKVF
jgi:hypothetical protein